MVLIYSRFTAELQEIIKHTPRKRQTMLFSATMTDNVSQLISLSLNRPIRLHVDNNNTIANKLVQEFIRVRGHREEARPAILVALCSRTYTEQSIIFFRSKAQAHQMKIIFEVLGLSASELHGNLTQPQRLESLEKFRNHESKFLLCTDLASRGLDIAGIKTVINYDMPATYQVYVHRVGRTARAAQGGRAVSLVGEHGRQILKMALDNSKEAVKHRIIPAAVVQKYEKLISDKEGDIIKILADEKRDKELDKMEMQVNRAHNMLEHEEEIMSRPKREWFQSERERKGEKVDTSMTKPPSVKPNGAKRGPFDGLSRHKKRQKLGFLN
jgi:ATP-dependent RNA helicase DDX27